MILDFYLKLFDVFMRTASEKTVSGPRSPSLHVLSYDVP